jgi:hypothetical protein
MEQKNQQHIEGGSKQEKNSKKRGQQKERAKYMCL